MTTTTVRVPDIGDFKDVEVIEVLVKAGDTIAAEQSLITLESDKASMEIPSPGRGRVSRLLLKVGDKVNEGTPILELEENATAPAPAPKAAPAPAGSAAVVPAGAPAAVSSSDADLSCRVLVLGSGPGGYSAAFRAADLGLDTILVERDQTLGGVCLNVGCIPSKALLHVAALIDEAAAFAAHGVKFGAPSIDLNQLRIHKNQVVGKLTGGLEGMAKARKVRVVRGVGSFLDDHHLAVTGASGTQRIRFEQAIIAAGSEAIHLPFAPKDPRIVDSTGALELPFVPKNMLIIGGGIIGLEMATVYSSLGARLDVVEMLDGLMQGADRDLVRIWQKMNAPRFDRIMLKTRTTALEATPSGIMARFEGEGAPAEPQRYDLVLEAVGRRPNGRVIGAERAGVKVDERGYVPVDLQMRTNVPHIFAIGDIVGAPMLAHKATHQGHVAAEAAAGEKSFFDARVIPSVAYTDPEVAWIGLTEDEAKARGQAVEKAIFPWAASGRAIANGRDEGATKLIFDPQSHRLLGAGIVGTHAGDLIGELALAIEMDADATDIGRTIHPHPTLSESVGLAAELYEGVCTDLPPPRRRNA